MLMSDKKKVVQLHTNKQTKMLKVGEEFNINDGALCGKIVSVYDDMYVITVTPGKRIRIEPPPPVQPTAAIKQEKDKEKRPTIQDIERSGITIGGYTALSRCNPWYKFELKRLLENKYNYRSVKKGTLQDCQAAMFVFLEKNLDEVPKYYQVVEQIAQWNGENGSRKAKARKGDKIDKKPNFLKIFTVEQEED